MRLQFLPILLSLYANVGALKTCNVLDFGAVVSSVQVPYDCHHMLTRFPLLIVAHFQADNRTDIGPALMKAFGCAQKSITNSPKDTIILVPAGKSLKTSPKKIPGIHKSCFVTPSLGDYRLASKVVFDKSKFFTLTVNGHLYMPYDPKVRTFNHQKSKLKSF